LETFKTSACWQHCYGAIEFLNYLKLQQHNGPKNNPPFKLGIISNFDPRLDVLLRNMKVNHYFDFVLSSYDCGFEKPDKKIFDKAMAASELKDLDPKECLHIGDTPITDYIGAKKVIFNILLIEIFI
jgi:HAD superfamily hydrolase (TIGR01549 family)